MAAWTLVIYCLVIVVVSVVGGLVPMVLRLDHRRMQLTLSLVAGVMLGVGLLHMLGHAAEAALHPPPGVDPPSMHAVMLAAVLGFLAMFLLERFFCFHHHESLEDTDETGSSSGQGGSDRSSPPPPASEHRLHWVGAFIGLTVHTVLAGIALGAATAAAGGGPEAESAGIAGFGVFLGIVLHKPFDSLTITALMRHAGYGAFPTHLVNLAFAMVIPIGVALFFVGRSLLDDGGGFTTLALAFSAGTFICVAASDVLPELQFHRHDRFGMSAMLVLGLVVAWASGLLEAHDHDHGGHGHGHGHSGHDHGHAGHDHGHSGHDHAGTIDPALVGPPAPSSGTEGR